MAQTSRLVIELDSRDAEAKAADTRKALEALEDAGLSIQPALNKAGAGMEKMGKGAEKATKSIENEADELERLLGQIDPVVRRLGELDKQEQDLAKHRKAGKLDTATYDEYKSKIDTARKGLTSFDDSLTRTGNTAKQTAAALRGVPAQFTDIAVSLQGGQAPLTVFLQQGGQLKDMFGGAGPAAKALGGYILGLVNPFTVAAAGLGTLAAVYVDAEKEVSAFNKALFSGSASSGQTADSLGSISKNAAALTGSLADSKAAVTALAASAGLSQIQFKNLAEAASAIGQFTGKSAAEVATALGSMGDNATKSAEKISAQYGLLTSAQYEVIRGLDEQGKRQEALDVLSESLNQNAQARFKRYRESLSDIERDWSDIGTAISNAYSRVRGELFPDDAKQIEIIERILKTRKEGGIAGAVSNGLSSLNSALGLGEGNNDDSTAALEKRVSMLKLGLWVNQQNAKVEGDATKSNQGRIEADSKWSELSKKELSDQARLVKDIADARKLGVEAGKSQADIDKVVADIQAKYDKSQAKPKVYNEDAGMKMLDSSRQAYAVLVQQNEAISDQGTKNEKLGAQAQALIRWEQQLADIKSKGTLTADQKALLASQDLITAQLKKNSALEKEVELRKTSKEEAEKLAAFQVNQTSRLSTAKDGLESQVAGMGLGSEARDRLKQDLAIQRDYARQSADLLEQRNTGRITQDLYDKESAVIQDGLNKRLAMQQNYYAQIDAYQSNWVNGVSEAWANYADAAQNSMQITSDFTAGTLGSARSELGNFFSDVATGSESAGDALGDMVGNFARSMVNALADMAAQWLIYQGVQLVMGKATQASAAGQMAANASATSLQAGLAAFASTAAIPIVGPILAPGAMATALSITGPLAGAVAAAATAGIGFSNGGYTGAGGVNDPAGTVHKGEIVWSQSDIRKFGGVASVEALRNGNVSAGRSASSGSSASTAARNGVPAPERPMTFNLIEDASRAGQVSRRQLGEQDVIDICVANIRGEKELHQVNQEKYGLQSQGA
ncbi:phage tail tape measure protein [Pseudomonas sp. ACN5]|uniref:phage tail tape measure protein n=1 Tax=Pseudomonas sp. ACN5 TaxID=1920427 RepID=UPI000BB2DF23|nr:phage tail tape measure protein [Pseudomonas sp. ACN5]PBJ02114.1 Prophage tail length tape measure protein [Pseudomonas sp. ACN5]